MAQAMGSGLVLIFACAACSVAGGDMPKMARAPGATQACSVTKAIARGGPVHGAHGLALDAAGHLLIASLAGNEIVTMDRDSGAILARRDLVAQGGPPAPDDLVLGPDGALYWTSLSTGRVSRLSADGTLTSRFVAPGADPIAFSSDGRLFVGLAFFGDGLYELDPKSLTTLRAIVPNRAGERPLGFLDGFAFGSDRRLYAPVWLRGSVVSIDVDSCNGAISPWTQCDIRVVATGLDAPSAVKFDSHGDLYVTSWGDGKVLRISKPTTRNPSAPELVAQLPPSLDNLVFDAGDRLFVSNGADGSIARIVDGKVDTIRSGGMMLPGGVAVMKRPGGAEALFVADFHSLRELSPSTGQQLAVDKTAPEIRPLGQPSSVSVDGRYLVLTSYATREVQIWDPTSHAVVESRTMKVRPYDAVRFQGDLAVSVSDPTRPQRRQGRVVRLRTGETLLGPADVVYPLGLAASGDLLFVSDWVTGLVWRVDASVRTPRASVLASGLDHPEGLALDRGGGLLVVEAGAGRLSRIELSTGRVSTVVDGLELGLVGQPPAQAPHLTLNGVAIASSGDVFVTGDEDDVLYRIRPSTGLACQNRQGSPPRQ